LVTFLRGVSLDYNNLE